MSKFDEAINKLDKVEWLLDKMSDWLGMSIRERNNTYGSDEKLFKIHKALELGKLYQKYYKEYDDLTMDELIDTLKQIKELENE